MGHRLFCGFSGHPKNICGNQFLIRVNLSQKRLFTFGSRLGRNVTQSHKFSVPYLSRPSRIIVTISSVVISTSIDGTSSGEVASTSGVNANVRPSFLRINTLPVFSACSSTQASFCLASEYVYTCTLNLQNLDIDVLSSRLQPPVQRQQRRSIANRTFKELSTVQQQNRLSSVLDQSQ